MNEMLSNACTMIRGTHAAAGMDLLTSSLDRLRSLSSNEEWGILRQVALSHPIIDALHQCPLTSRAYRKPRGYPGDAVLIDLIYSDVSVGGVDISDIGRQVYNYCFNAAQCRSVRSRLEIVSHAIDECAKRGGAHILSVACGHLREAALSEAVGSRCFAAFHAVDQDLESLAEVDRCCRSLGVIPMAGSVIDIIKRRLTGLDAYDLVYAAGLYDYLNDKVAALLTRELFHLLRPGGRLLIGNFRPGVFGTGYMETYMDWLLIYRDNASLYELIRLIPPASLATAEHFTDADGVVGYLLVTRS